MSKIAYLRNLREESSTGVPAWGIYYSINPVFKLLSANKLRQNVCLLSWNYYQIKTWNDNIPPLS